MSHREHSQRRDVLLTEGPAATVECPKPIGYQEESQPRGHGARAVDNVLSRSKRKCLVIFQKNEQFRVNTYDVGRQVSGITLEPGVSGIS